MAYNSRSNSLYKQNSNSISSNKHTLPNDDLDTLRIAILGGSEVGKTSLVNRLTMKFVPESHYPTLKVNNWLFQFEPVNDLSRLILDEHKHERMLFNLQREHSHNKITNCIYQTPELSDHIVLSHKLFENEINNFIKFKNKYCSTKGADIHIDKEVLMTPKNNFYKYNDTFTGLYDNHSLKATVSNSSIKHTLSSYTPGTSDQSYLINPTLSQLSHCSSISNISNGRTFSNAGGESAAAAEEEDIIPIYNASHNNLITKENTLVKFKPVLPKIYTPPFISNILIDVIDTPAFKPSNMLPFLEVSLFRENLGVPYLQDERNRRLYNDNIDALVTFTGSSELNGNIDAYILAYSCYPKETEPPIYQENATKESHNSTDSNSNTSYKNQNNNSDQNHLETPKIMTEDASHESNGCLLSDLITMKEMLCDAWKNYKEYMQGWEEGHEGDVYSVMYNLRKKWESAPLSTFGKSSKKNKNFIEDDMPPIVIVATHTLSELTSPLLLEEGKKLANEWGCSFVAVDSFNDYQCEEALSVAVAESILYKQGKLNHKKMT